MRVKTALFILLSGLVLVSCGKKDARTNGNIPDDIKQENATVATFKYYKGGYMTVAPNPNWSNDMTISFTTTGFFIEGRHPDALCSRGGNFTQAQAEELFRLGAGLTVSVKAAGGTQLADAGVEFIEISAQDGQKRKYHLLNAEVPVGEMFAVNPRVLHDYLQALEAGLPTFCQ